MNRSSYIEFLQNIKSENFGQKVNRILEGQRRSQIWLAEQIGISKQALSYILNHSQKPKYISEIASILGVSPQWLKGEEIYDTDLVQPANMGRRIPIHNMRTFQLQKLSDTAPKECIIIDAALSLDCFAVLLDNSSMEPLFKKKSVLIFNPDKTAENENFVLAKLYNDNNDVFFRQIIINGKDIYFKAIDPLYAPVINEPHDILGVLIESRIVF